MPIQISQRCLDCGKTKPRRDFPTVVVGRNNKTGKSKRIWKPYCKACELVRITTGVNPDKEPPDKLLER